MDYKQCVEYIFSIPLFSKKSGNNNTKELLRRLGNPHLDLKCIHVAGTNGKGSVCSMLSYIYTNTNLKVGLFTSPHLENINERIKINNRDINEKDFLGVFTLVKKEIDNMIKEGFTHPGFFETLFSMALLYFKEQKVNIAIIETGLGGKLDVTNLIERPILTIITQIGLDHMEILGDTIEKITLEKAGIIKENCPTVISNNQELVLDIIRKKAKNKKSFLYEVMPLEYKILKRTGKSIDFSLKNKYYNYKRFTININATYQIYNLATVLNAVYALRESYQVNLTNIEGALEKFYWPGRMEIIDDWLLLDGSHNENGIMEFVKNINSYFSNRKITILFTVMKNKSYQAMINELINCKNINKIIITKVEQDRCIEPELLSVYFKENGFKSVDIEMDLDKVIKEYSNKESELLCCIGSLYLVGVIKKILGGKRSD